MSTMKIRFYLVLFDRKRKKQLLCVLNHYPATIETGKYLPHWSVCMSPQKEYILHEFGSIVVIGYKIIES